MWGHTVTPRAAESDFHVRLHFQDGLVSCPARSPRGASERPLLLEDRKDPPFRERRPLGSSVEGHLPEEPGPHTPAWASQPSSGNGALGAGALLSHPPPTCLSSHSGPPTPRVSVCSPTCWPCRTSPGSQLGVTAEGGTRTGWEQGGDAAAAGAHSVGRAPGHMERDGAGEPSDPGLSRLQAWVGGQVGQRNPGTASFRPDTLIQL